MESALAFAMSRAATGTRLTRRLTPLSEFRCELVRHPPDCGQVVRPLTLEMDPSLNNKHRDRLGLARALTVFLRNKTVTVLLLFCGIAEAVDRNNIGESTDSIRRDFTKTPGERI